MTNIRYYGTTILAGEDYLIPVGYFIREDSYPTDPIAIAISNPYAEFKALPIPFYKTLRQEHVGIRQDIGERLREDGGIIWLPERRGSRKVKKILQEKYPLVKFLSCARNGYGYRVAYGNP